MGVQACLAPLPLLTRLPTPRVGVRLSVGFTFLPVLASPPPSAVHCGRRRRGRRKDSGHFGFNLVCLKSLIISFISLSRLPRDSSEPLFCFDFWLNPSGVNGQIGVTTRFICYEAGNSLCGAQFIHRDSAIIDTRVSKSNSISKRTYPLGHVKGLRDLFSGWLRRRPLSSVARESFLFELESFCTKWILPINSFWWVLVTD